MGLRRAKIRQQKSQEELRLATAIKGNKKWSYNYMRNKRRVKDNPHPLLGAAGNVATKDKENAEVLRAFLWLCR